MTEHRAKAAWRRRAGGGAGAIGAALFAAMTSSVAAAPAKPPVDLTAQIKPAPAVKPAPAAQPAPTASGSATPTVAAPNPLTPAPPAPSPAPHWSTADAQALLGAIRAIGSEGLFARDYEPTALAAAIGRGESPELDALATKLFTWLAEDRRDGRTPMDSRLQWFVVDPDADTLPLDKLLNAALAGHDIPGALAALDPTAPDYAQLREELAQTTDPQRAALIRVNMERWRWLPHDLGVLYLITNVPEQMLRLAVNHKNITTYRTIVGKPGKTQTPSLMAQVQGVVFNPTWTVPQSIVKGEGLGARLAGCPACAARQGYKVTKTKDGTIIVVQQPGKGNSLGALKLDMPNPHAIFIHDTPNHKLFDLPARALSHGCIRTDRASELGMTMAMLGADLTEDQGVQYTLSGKYTRVAMTKTFPVYITYFTMARDVNGAMRAFSDIYGRDGAVIASLAAPRQPHTWSRQSKEAVVKLDNPL